MKGPKIVEVSYKEHASTSEPHKLSQLSMGTFRIVSPRKTLPRGAPFPTTALVDLCNSYAFFVSIHLLSINLYELHK